jgi:hypothetical protein
MQGLLSGVVLGRLSDYWGRFPCYLTALMCEVCESGPFKQPFIYLKNRSFYRDRLGANIGKALKKQTVFSQGVMVWAIATGCKTTSF